MIEKWKKISKLISRHQAIILSFVVVLGVSTVIFSINSRRESVMNSSNITVVDSTEKKDAIDSDMALEELTQEVSVSKTKAYKIEVEDGISVVLGSIEDVEKVLSNVQDRITDVATQVEVVDSTNEVYEVETNIVIKPEAEALSSKRELVMANLEGDSDLDLPDVWNDEASNEALLLKEPDAEVISVDFAEAVSITSTYVTEEEILDITTATEYLTKENEEPDVYYVVAGDVPSIIAENNDMSLSELYALNEGLVDNPRGMQIGDELIVMVPEPELSVKIEEVVVYNEAIASGVTYVDDPDLYIGVSKEIEEGSDGVAEVTAVVTKINGYESDRNISDEQIIVEPVDTIIAKGIKALPTKETLSKSFVSPLESYTITSAFGPRWGEFHQGVDMAASYGTSVMAAESGTVVYAGWYNSYGYLVEIDHGGGVVTRYGHNSQILVSVGQEVEQYDVIAKVGSTGNSTGNHVHFEIRLNDVCLNPLDYLD